MQEPFIYLTFSKYIYIFFLCFLYVISVVDGKEVGNIQSQLLCRSILDLYIGEDPFDRQAKEEVELKLVSLLQK